MSATRTFHASAWPLLAISAAVLYVTTWPVIEMKCRDRYESIAFTEWLLSPSPSPFLPAGDMGGRGKWISIVYGPLNLMRDAKFTANPFHLYREWWDRRLNPRFFLS